MKYLYNATHIEHLYHKSSYTMYIFTTHTTHTHTHTNTHTHTYKVPTVESHSITTTQHTEKLGTIKFQGA